MFGISKSQISELPVAHFPGRAIVIDNLREADHAIEQLSKEKIVGFDTETRPSFTKGHLHKVALMQLSTLNECYLIRLNMTGLFPSLRRFLENPDIIKIGLSVKDDFTSLHRLAECEPKGFVELQNFVKEFQIADNSLQKIYAVIFRQRISKSQRLTNWEAPSLTDSQQAYASLDAWACLRIYNHLRAGGFNPSECKYIIDEPNESAPEK